MPVPLGPGLFLPKQAGITAGASEIATAASARTKIAREEQLWRDGRSATLQGW
jgi:hypothetical protein